MASPCRSGGGDADPARRVGAVNAVVGMPGEPARRCRDPQRGRRVAGRPAPHDDDARHSSGLRPPTRSRADLPCPPPRAHRVAYGASARRQPPGSAPLQGVGERPPGCRDEPRREEEDGDEEPPRSATRHREPERGWPVALEGRRERAPPEEIGQVGVRRPPRSGLALRAARALAGGVRARAATRAITG